MSTLLWDQPGERRYETGVDRGVLYIPDASGAYVNGFAWNGLTTVTESPSGAEANPQYADNIKYLNLLSAEQFGCTIEAFTYPDAWQQCDGSATPEPGVAIGQQPRKTFGLSYRTRVGTDLDSEAGYKLHLVYGALAAPSEKAYATVNDSPEATSLSWDVTTTPVDLPGYKPTASITIDSTKVSSTALATLQDFLWGTASSDPMLPTPEAVLAIFAGTVTQVTPGVPTYDAGTDVVTIPSTVGVVYKIDGKVVTGGVNITGDTVVNAYPAVGYKFPAKVADEWFFAFA